MKKISCIVPAYNEWPRIWAVLKVLSEAKKEAIIDEIIVIDDGSKDDTSEVASKFEEITLITQKNTWKTWAVINWIKKSKNELLMFIDSDLRWLEVDSIKKLAEPVLSWECEISLSLRENSLWIYKKMWLDFVTWERVLPKSNLMSYLEEMASIPGFWLESFMNQLIIDNQIKFKSVYLPWVLVTNKTEKMWFWKGVKWEIWMILEIIKTIWFFTIFKHNYYMMKLKIK
jgi:glycosyltransferase involved in cell wall biosynthesis